MTSTIARTPTVPGPQIHRGDEILLPEALAFVAVLDGAFAGRRADPLAERRSRARRISAGETPGFLGSSRSVRNDNSWQVAAPAPGLIDRRVEITGPTTPKMTGKGPHSGGTIRTGGFEEPAG